MEQIPAVSEPDAEKRIGIDPEIKPVIFIKIIVNHKCFYYLKS